MFCKRNQEGQSPEIEQHAKHIKTLSGHKVSEGNTSVSPVLLTVRGNIYLSVQTGDLTQHVLYTPHHRETHKTAPTIITARQSIQPRTQIEF